MNCNKTRQAIISGQMTKKVSGHLVSCTSCREMHEKVNKTMALLDEEVSVPETLAPSILSKIEKSAPRPVKKLNLLTYIQVAAAVCFGIFIGHQFGRYAGPVNRTAKTDAVTQYFKAHHLNLDHSDFRSPSFINPNRHD